MNPYPLIYAATKNGESLLSLGCGIGLELQSLGTADITAVDIAPQYLEVVPAFCSGAKLIQDDVTDYIESQPDKSVDVISLVDVLEHLTKVRGRSTLENCKRVAKRRVIVFTQDGYVKNEPHNAWGIKGADKHQKHLSGWTQKELEKLGFTLLARTPEVSQHGEEFYSLLMEYVA